ncbi:acyltransferase [Phyllobacterium sp. BT25]|uniref:Acyltransferase n=1 Tax=Phyllobacterium pellucidum TaxID=2740464 RepID=A0A849VPB8_9HYPH|nr:acyltransferase family protein [Phyllobacterium pellucidum]NTS31286.1 acyltransferase [Phyllobacterium pellucidum]
MQPQYRPEIDGLRAVAVGIVVIFHAFPGALPGGFVGVDIFFVISGFLITGIIVKSLESGTFSLSAFYGRRVRRIYPALCLVLAATAIASLAVLSTAQLQMLGRHGVAAALFIPNLIFWHEAGYFDAASETKPLLHLWSLGIEEQFYILWPALVALIFRKRKTMVTVFCGITIISLLYSVYATNWSPTAAFFSPLSRAWELSAGSLLAVLPTRNLKRGEIIAAGGLLLIGLSAVFQRSDLFFPGPAALLPVVGTCAIIAAGNGAAFNRTILSSPAFVGLGLISYPLYLWHWPVFSLARIAIGAPTALQMAYLVGISVGLAAATYLLLERRVQRQSLKTAFSHLFPTMCALGVVFALTSYFDLRSLWYSSDINKILAYSKYDYVTDAREGSCWFIKADGTNDFGDECDRFSPLSKKVAIWGDSYSARLYPGLRAEAGAGIEIAQFSVSNCPPGGSSDPYCNAMTAKVIQRLAKSRPDVVLIYARWAGYSSDWASGQYADGLRASIDALHQIGSNVVLIGQFPEYPKNLPDVLFDLWNADRSHIPERIADLPTKQNEHVDGQIRHLASENGTRYFSLTDVLCNDQGCLARIPGKASDIISWDFGHFTTAGARIVARPIMESVTASLDSASQAAVLARAGVVPH